MHEQDVAERVTGTQRPATTHPLVASGDDSLWAAFASAATAEQFCACWLTIVCRSIPDVVAAFLLLEEENGHYRVGAAWPDAKRDLAYLSPAAELALRQRRGLVHQAGAAQTRAHVAYPIEIDGHLHGVVVVDLGAGEGRDHQPVLRQLHWGIGWLQTMFHRRDAEATRVTRAQSAAALAVLDAACQHRTLQAAALAVVNEVATRLRCRRASLGIVRHGDIRLVAISHGARFARRSDIVAAIENAMEETLDQARSVAMPQPAGTRAITLAHASLARLSGGGAVCSVELRSGGMAVAVLTAERDTGDGFDAGTVATLELIAERLAPAIEMKRRADRLLAGRAADGAADLARVVFGPRRPAAKLIATVATAAVLTLLLWRGDFTVSGHAVVEASQLHALVAPFDGFIAAAGVRAGEAVVPGEVLAQLDDRDLRLEAVRARSALEEQRLKYGEAIGKQDRVAIRVLQAGIDEARAQAAIADDRITQAALSSTVRGTVVSGDLSQMIGSPVERGKTLFEVAPLDAWRVAVGIDERDIAAIRPGQHGRLLLAGLTGHAIPFTVRAVVPVASETDGRNSFRVEADLQDRDNLFRPGMEGVGKIRIDRRPLLEIWLRPVAAWVRMTVWTWWP